MLVTEQYICALCGVTLAEGFCSEGCLWDGVKGPSRPRAPKKTVLYFPFPSAIDAPPLTEWQKKNLGASG